jgi:HPt (histidine-containing phosphotransfer) domain-containing protein
MSDVVLVDVEDGLKRINNNTKLYVKLMEKFKVDVNFSNLEAALSSGDNAKAQVSAHTLKGIAANLSLIELHKQSLEIESQIKTGSIKPEQLSIVKDIYNQTIKEVDKVIGKYA